MSKGSPTSEVFSTSEVLLKPTLHESFYTLDDCLSQHMFSKSDVLYIHFMQFEQGRAYHVYNRSINQELLYKSDENYRYFMDRLNHYLDNKIDVLAYCLMPTHFHFFIRATEDSSLIEKGFKNLFISYAKSINVAYGRTGSIFQAKYKKEPIVDDFHFTNIIAYIHLNPVKAKLCQAPADWKYSSYNAILTDTPSKVKRDEIVEWFGTKQKLIDFHKAYRGNDWIDRHLPE